MSTRTDAILFWGINFGDMEKFPMTFKRRNEILNAIRSNQSIEVPEPDEPGWIGPAWEDWREKLKQWENKQCSLNYHRSSDYPVWYATVNESTIRAARGYPQEIKSLEINPEWEPKLRAFCERFGLPWSEPKWLLVSYWG